MNKINKYLILLTFSLSIIILCFIPFNATQFIPEIEEQVEKDLGVKIHIERLILRVGPTIKIKAPVMHLTYQNGKKFAQIDNAKFYLPWSSLLKKKPIFTALKANKLNVRINSDDEGLQDIINLLTQKSVEETPSLKIKEYSISYIDKVARDKFSLNGHLLETKKILKYNNFKISTKGEFLINSKKYITYDILLTPNLNFSKEKINIDVIKLIENIKELDFRADIITDLKLYKSVENKLQASGFINVDNITVLDVTQKGPKSFIYVTLWGDKASLLSNIYTSANQKVSIEGVINNSPKTNLDFKVKTDEIELKDLYKKLRILFDLSFLKNLEALDGKLNANFSIKGDINKIKSNGYLKINNASLKANGVAINKINSEIDFSNNNINIVKAVGYVLDSPIMAKGTINKNIDIEILMNKVELKHLCPSILGVKKGILSLVANITGSLENIIHKENLQISNLELSNDYGQIFLESLKIDTHRSAIANIDNIICKIPDLSTIKIPSMKLFIDDDTLRITDTNIFMQNSNFVLKSDVTNFNSKEFTFNTLLTGNINSKDISCLECLAQQYPVQLSINGNRIVQNLNLQLLLDEHSIFKEKTLANLISKVEKNIFKIEDLSLMSFDGTLTSDFKANMKGIKKLSINGVVENLAKPIMKNLRVYIPQQLNLNFLDSSVQIKGDMFLNVCQTKDPELYKKIMEGAN